MRFSKKLAVAAVATVATVGVATSAFAYWSSSGSGTGSAGAGSASAVTVNQTSVVSAMGPGIAAQPLSGTFSVAHPSYVGQVTAAVTGTTKAGQPNPGCGAADFTVVQPTATNGEISNGSLWGGGSIAFNDNPTANQDVCQNATVVIAYSSN